MRRHSWRCWSCWLRVRFEHGETALLNFNYCNVLEKGAWGWVKLAPNIGKMRKVCSIQSRTSLTHPQLSTVDCFKTFKRESRFVCWALLQRVFSSLCEMQTTRYEGDRSEIACLQSHGAMYRVGVSPVLHEWRGRNSAREKKKGVMARSSWGRWNAGLCVSMCSWGTDLQLQFGAVRCISAACNFASLAFPIKLSLSKSIPGSAHGRFVGLDFISFSGTWNVPSWHGEGTRTRITKANITQVAPFHLSKSLNFCSTTLLSTSDSSNHATQGRCRWWSNMPVSTAITSLAGRDDGGRHSPAVRGAGRSAQCYLRRNQAGRSETVCGNWIIWFIYQLMDYGKFSRSNNEKP